MSPNALRRDAQARFRPYRQYHDEFGKPTDSRRPCGVASLTKGGLNAVTQELAIEFAKSGVRVNAVSPGIIKTPMNPPETHGFLSALHPVGRMGEIKDIVDAVLYLEGANFVTGEIIHVDGGQSAGRW